MVCRNFVYILWSVPSSPKNIATQGSHIVWGIGVQVVCVDFIYSSWQQEGSDVVVYINSEKDQQISISSSPKKYCDTRIAYCLRNCCAGGVCRFCTQIMATRGERCDCLHRFRKGQTDLNLILSKKYCDTRIAYCVRNRCADGVSILYTAHGDRREMWLSTQIQKRTDRSQSHPLQKILRQNDRILCEKLLYRWCV